MTEQADVIGLHRCQNQRVEMEAGSPLLLTPCERPAMPCVVDGQDWWLCEHHQSIWRDAATMVEGYRPGPTTHSEG